MPQWPKPVPPLSPKSSPQSDCEELAQWITVYELRLGDVEDPDFSAQVQISQWRDSERGQWVLDNAVDKVLWQHDLDQASLYHRYVVRAKLPLSALSFYYLKWG